ncbi:hypothetical protein [Acidovorax temperans]|nr:hypothetical protein [Acidovorax temperans]WCT26349.1 hypothetical protein PQV96_10310 [Acidovorax temperans]
MNPSIKYEDVAGEQRISSVTNSDSHFTVLTGAAMRLFKPRKPRLNNA